MVAWSFLIIAVSIALVALFQCWKIYRTQKLQEFISMGSSKKYEPQEYIPEKASSYRSLTELYMRPRIQPCASYDNKEDHYTAFLSKEDSLLVKIIDYFNTVLNDLSVDEQYLRLTTIKQMTNSVKYKPTLDYTIYLHREVRKEIVIYTVLLHGCFYSNTEEENYAEIIKFVHVPSVTERNIHNVPSTDLRAWYMPEEILHNNATYLEPSTACSASTSMVLDKICKALDEKTDKSEFSPRCIEEDLPLYDQIQ